MPTNRPSPPVITLTTDFGTSDHFVGVMKGVILSICPEARVTDITHDVQPFQISQGAFLISQAFPYFPRGTIHVVVVDPGVGTARRPILVEAAGQRFIAPDNGVLAMVYADLPHTVREITAEKYFLPSRSSTFHGRDIFAPTAAHLARGARPSSVGAKIEDHLKIAFYQPQRSSKRRWTGTILHVDHFGNIITNFHVDQFEGIGTRPFELEAGPRRISRLALNYSETESGEPFAIVGSSGFIEIAINQGSAAAFIGCGPGAPVDLSIY
ncbi:MAG: SAM-dependent chlorinase/fluorinase [Bryobacteraceae bacterium]|nr:SAM-dependent chlorinase/fluorinase [Bryobacteraceae bacterium]